MAVPFSSFLIAVAGHMLLTSASKLDSPQDTRSGLGSDVGSATASVKFLFLSTLSTSLFKSFCWWHIPHCLKSHVAAQISRNVQGANAN